MEQEIWKIIEDYPMYEVSNLGKVRKISSGQLLKQCLDSKGYPSVNVNDGKKATLKVVHRFVAKAFIPNPSGYKEIDHIDTDKSNNHKNNLRWCNRSINMSNPITAKANGVRKSKPILRIDEQGNTKRYNSISSVVADGFPRTAITYYCDKSNKRYKGFLWKRL